MHSLHERPVLIQNGKGAKDRITLLPEMVIPNLKKHLTNLRGSTVDLCLGSMSRPLRIEYEGAWYHVMNRGR